MANYAYLKWIFRFFLSVRDKNTIFTTNMHANRIKFILQKDTNLKKQK